MAAPMDLDLNFSPPSPDPAAQDGLKRAMLRQEHTFRDQVKDLHRLYWAQKNLKDVPFWNQSDDMLYAHHSLHASYMIDLNEGESPSALSDSFVLGKQASGCGDQFAEENLDVKGLVRIKPDPGSQQERSGYRGVIDLEKPATSDDDIINYAHHNCQFSDNSQCVPLVTYSPRMSGQLCKDQNAPLVSSGSIESSDTPDSHSPVKAKASASGRMFIDLNIAQEDDFNVCPDPSKVLCARLASSTTIQSGDFCNNSSNAVHKGSEYSIGSSKLSSITVVASISAPDSSREVTDAGLFHESQSRRLFHVEASKHNSLAKDNIQSQHVPDKISGLHSSGCMEIPRNEFSIRSNGGNNYFSGLHKPDDNRCASLNVEPAVVQGEHQEETSMMISVDEMEGIDLNICLESIDMPSTVSSSVSEKHVNNDRSEENLPSNSFNQKEGLENISSLEYPTNRDHDLAAEDTDSKNVQSPDSGIAIYRSISIPETPEGRDYACPRLRSLNPPNTNIMHEAGMEECDEIAAATAAETIVSMFTSNTAWMIDSDCSNNQIDAHDGIHEPQLSLDSFEEGVMNLEEMKDDVESNPIRLIDEDGPSCGIKLKRGRGMRDFQREILPGLVSLARHEICDDLHAIGYELRKTRSRRTPGYQCPPSTRSRLPRRCSAAWNQ